MPFKTKKKKLAAIKHRVAVSAGGGVSYRIVEEPAIVAKNGETSRRNLAQVDSFDGPDVKNELVRIVLLAGIIIGLQLALKLTNLPFLN